MSTTEGSGEPDRPRAAGDVWPWRAKLAGLLRNVAERLHPLPRERSGRDARISRIVMVPGFERLDQAAWRRGEVVVRFRATDPTWLQTGGDHLLVGLREHVRRLCKSAHELSMTPLEGRWADVAHNLKLAHSLTDVFADTDIDDSSMWCSPAADYEEADSEVAAKHLAAVIVFTLVWTAYECAVDMLASGGAGKGAKGRDLVASIVPYPRRQGAGRACSRLERQMHSYADGEQPAASWDPRSRALVQKSSGAKVRAISVGDCDPAGGRPGGRRRWRQPGDRPRVPILRPAGRLRTLLEDCPDRQGRHNPRRVSAGRRCVVPGATERGSRPASRHGAADAAAASEATGQLPEGEAAREQPPPGGPG